MDKKNNSKEILNTSIKLKYPQIPVLNRIKKLPFLNKFSKPIIVCGKMNNFNLKDKIIKLSESLGAPIFADPLSKMRYGINHTNILSAYEHFLQSNDIYPDLVIRFGTKPTSKKLCSLLDKWELNTILIDPTGRFNEDCPNILEGDPKNNVNELIKLSADYEKNDWINKIIKLEKKSRTIINKKLNSSLLTNGSTAKISLESLQSGDTIFVGNSLPIRDIDLFTINTDKNINIYANRGASGIDGIISTAMGISHSNSSSNCKNLLLIGDLSFYHDMNGLIAAKRYNINLIIIVENNHGGGIFRKLSINDNNPNFQEFWETPLDISIEKIAELYHAQFERVKTNNQLKKCLEKMNPNGLKIIEALIDT
jgi:2-succinyl-5-enolpyruvyl-6-hydroxy-3-cyclohexene-1-carboxylate synthase